MRVHERSLILLAFMLPELSTAWSLPQFDFRLPFSSQPGTPEPQGVLESATDSVRPLRIAIIGAGAGGSSAAFWISKAKERHEQDIHVDVYEQSDYIGGRSTVVYPYNDTSLRWTELGGSIFVNVNRNMMRAAKEFNLTLSTFDSEADNQMGIWDGHQIVLDIKGSGWASWFDNIKMLWRYGYSSLRKAPKVVDALVETIKELYTPSIRTWTSIRNLADATKWLPITSQTAAEYMTGQGIGELFIHELQEAMTRVNYGQNVDEIHALMGSVSMATDGAVGVEGGNYKIFENFLKSSGASVHLNTKVTGLRKTSTDSASPKWLVSVASDSSSAPEIPAYDHVILAAPFASSQITILGSPASTTLNQPPVEYVHLHVTLVTTTAPSFSPAYFGLKEGASVPAMILTTWDAVRHYGDAVAKPEFNSINYLNKVKDLETHGGDEWAVKIFSSERVSDEWLGKLFGGQDKVGWVYRKEWDAYPRGRPTTEFPPLHPDSGLWYINSFEPLISTMETETLSARNVVDNLFQSQFAAGICPPDAELSSETSESVEEDLKKNKDGWGGTGPDGRIYGWDC